MVIKIPVVLTYSNAGAKQAQKGIFSLGKEIKKFGLGSKLSLAAATTAVTIFAKKSVAAALAEEKAQRKLSNTLANVGKSYALVSTERFIKDLEQSTGISKEKLRPELEKLLLTTRSVGEAQDILNTALNVSAGSSYSIGQVTNALIKAQKGNFKSLNTMALGLDKATIKSENFYTVQQELNKLFANQSTIAAQGLEGDLNKIGIAANNSKEIIGKQLSGALSTFIKNAGGVENITRLFNDMNGSIEKSGGLLDKVAATLGTAVNVASGNFALGFVNALGQAFSIKSKTTDLYSEDQRLLKRIGNIQVTLAQEAAEAAKKAAAAEKLRLARLAAQKKLQAKFDQTNIAIEAALLGKLSEEDKKRLLALKAAKSETATDDMKALEELNEAQKKAAAEEMARIAEQDAARKKAISSQKTEFAALQAWLSSNPLKIYTEYTNTAGQTITAPKDFGLPTAPQTPQKKSVAPTIILNTGDTNTNPSTNTGYVPPTPQQQAAIMGQTGNNITVNVNAGTIADENKLTYIIADQIVKYVRFGGTTAPAGFI